MIHPEQSLAESLPSFHVYSSSSRLVDIAARVVHDEDYHSDALDRQELMEGDADYAEEEIDSDFEFAVPWRDDDASPPLISADEIFYNGQIRPIFPLFNTADFIHRDSACVSDGEDEDGAVAEAIVSYPKAESTIKESETTQMENMPLWMYCEWKPKISGNQGEEEEAMRKKNNSTGTSSKRWKLRELLQRSIGDGRETLVSLTARGRPNRNGTKNGQKTVMPAGMKTEKRRSVDDRAGKVGEIRQVKGWATREGDRKASYLPYRQDHVGFFVLSNEND